MVKPPSVSCSATGTNKAVCLLGQDFLRARELLLLPIRVDQPDVIPVRLPCHGAVVTPLIAHRFVRRVIGKDGRLVRKHEMTILAIGAKYLEAVDALAVGDTPLQQRAMPRQI